MQNPTHKRKIREQAFKLLFQAEFKEKADAYEASNLYFDILKEEMNTISEEEFEVIKSEADKKFKLCMEKLPQIDDMINAADLGQKTERFGQVELTVTRLALYEMLYDDNVPEAVAINEAVELTKMYATAEAAGFVNGVLAQFSKDRDKSTSKGKRTQSKNALLDEKKSRKNSAKVYVGKAKKDSKAD